jgi:hypothetical protein
MFEQRMKEYEYTFKPVPRSAAIRALEGYYTLPPSDYLYREYLRSKSKLSFSRWLLKTKLFNPNEVAKICKKVAESSRSVKISGRFNDILRMSSTKHFNTCARPGGLGKFCPQGILLDPNAGIIYDRDNSGQYLGRIIFRIKDNGEIQLFRPYGTVTAELARRLLEQLGYKVCPCLEDTVIYYNELHYNELRRLQLPPHAHEVIHV